MVETLTRKDLAKDSWALLMHNYRALADKDKQALNFIFNELKEIIENDR